MRVIDLSHTIHPGMPLFPGAAPPRLEKTATLEKDGFVEHRVSMCTHTGTHIDVPSHIIAGGLTLDRLASGHFMGRAAVIDVSMLAGKIIEVKNLKPYEEAISKVDHLILKTGWEKYWGDRRYFEGFPVLDSGAAEWLCNFGLKGIGIDAVSVDPVESHDVPVHRILFRKDLIIIENLTNLDAIGEDMFFFSCLPLRIQGCEGSPVRAVAFFPDEVS